MRCLRTKFYVLLETWSDERRFTYCEQLIWRHNACWLSWLLKWCYISQVGCHSQKVEVFTNNFILSGNWLESGQKLPNELIRCHFLLNLNSEFRWKIKLSRLKHLILTWKLILPNNESSDIIESQQAHAFKPVFSTIQKSEFQDGFSFTKLKAIYVF